MIGRWLTTGAAVLGAALAGGCPGPTDVAAYDPAALPPAAAPSPPGPPPGPARALPELTERSGLDDYLAYAALNNPHLAAAFYRWRAAAEVEPQARALPDPRLTYQHYLREVETRVGAQQQAVGIAQTFPWFGKRRLRGEAAAEAAGAARQRYEAAKLELFFRVRQAYYDCYYLGRVLATTEENFRLLKYLENVVRLRYRNQADPQSALLRLQVELGRLQDRLAGLRDRLSPTAAALNAALSRPPDAPLPLPASIPAETTDAADAQLLAWQAQASPALRAMQFEVAASRRRIDLARKEYYPDLTLGLTYIDTNASTGGRHPDGDGDDPVIAMLSMNVPIWRAKYDAGVREARAGSRAVRLERAALADALALRLKTTAYRYRDAHREVGLYRDTLLPKARQAYRIAETDFSTGKAGFNDLIDAQRTLLDLQLAHHRAQAERAKALAEIDLLVGRPVPRAPEAPPETAQPEETK